MSAARSTSRLALGLLAGLLLLVFSVPTATAQQPDPYGPTTTTTTDDSDREPTCVLNPVQALPGQLVTATVTNVFFGETVNINFDGVVVATKKAPDAPEVEGESVGAPVVFNGPALAAQALTTTLLIDFRIPANAGIGNHTVTATGATFTCFCSPNGVFKVLGSSAGSNNNPGGSSLARTGIYAGLLLAIAVALLLAGRAAMKASKERRRRRQPTMAFHLEEDRQILGPRR
jgi:hypothetical protein